MSGSQASFIAPGPPDSYRDVIRELMAYDALCFRCNQLPRNEMGCLYQQVIPSPLHWSRQTEYPWAVLESQLDKRLTVLEVSGGHSVLKFALAKRCRSVIDTEYERFYMPTIQETIDLQAFNFGFDNITQVWADVRELPYPDNWLDRVFCISVLEHIPEGHSKGLEEMVRVLKPGGILMLSMDIVVDGEVGVNSNFYCDQTIASDILSRLQISKVFNPNPNGQIYTVGVTEKGPLITAMLVKYVKPIES